VRGIYTVTPENRSRWSGASYVVGRGGSSDLESNRFSFAIAIEPQHQQVPGPGLVLQVVCYILIILNAAPRPRKSENSYRASPQIANAHVPAAMETGDSLHLLHALLNGHFEQILCWIAPPTFAFHWKSMLHDMSPNGREQNVPCFARLKLKRERIVRHSAVPTSSCKRLNLEQNSLRMSLDARIRHEVAYDSF
jgi:hypothetical protein